MHPLTRSCFLLLVLGRLFLLAPSVPWNLPSRWIPPFPPRALVYLDSLPPHDLVLWTDGSVPFPFGKGGSGVLANCSLCGTEATLSFSAGPVCSSFSAEACAILHALYWSRKHQRICHFSSIIQLSLCSLLHLSFYLKLCGRSIKNCLLSPCVLSGYNGSPYTHFLRGTTRLISWPDREHYLCSLQSLASLSYPLLSFLGLEAYGRI